MDLKQSPEQSNGENSQRTCEDRRDLWWIRLGAGYHAVFSVLYCSEHSWWYLSAKSALTSYNERNHEVSYINSIFINSNAFWWYECFKNNDNIWSYTYLYIYLFKKHVNLYSKKVKNKIYFYHSHIDNGNSVC